MSNEMKKPWWVEATGYIIYPEAFCDSNGDGIGDLPGIISKLDYLADLGIDLLWICPFFASPMDDFGYDVQDYRKVNPRFGKDEDFDTLIREAHARGIRLLVDFVMNHTSSEHEWFKEALKNPNSPTRGYYYFENGKLVDGELQPPNNWRSYFSESAWERVPGSDVFYLHLFSSKMPDVNWNNPELRKRYYEIARYYLDKGVDGFRLDALSHLGKDTTFADSSLPVGADGFVLDPSKYANRPEMYEFLKEFKEEVLKDYDCLTLGEAGGGISPEESLLLTDKENGSINMVFNFDTAWCNGAYGSIDKKDEEITVDVLTLKDNFKKWYDKTRNHVSALPLYWNNHDHPRSLSQYGNVAYRKQAGKMLMATLLFSYGTPFIFYGEEIGMSNCQFDKPEDFFADVSARNETNYLRSLGYSDEHIAHYLCRCSRVNGRQPMQWNASFEGGFSSKVGAVKANPNYAEGVNVEDEAKDPDSILNFTKFAISLRKNEEVRKFLEGGKFHLYDRNHPDVYAYLFEKDEERLVVIASFRPYDTLFGFWWRINDVLLHNYEDFQINDHVFTLRPYEVIVLKA